MSAYLQMGHQSRNLVNEEVDDFQFSGIILSPVNRKSEDMERDISDFIDVKEYDIGCVN